MTFSIHGLAVARGIAIGRAVIVASSRVDVAHYFIADDQVPTELRRLRDARDAALSGQFLLPPGDGPDEDDFGLGTPLPTVRRVTSAGAPVDSVMLRLFV